MTNKNQIQRLLDEIDYLRNRSTAPPRNRQHAIKLMEKQINALSQRGEK